MVGLKNLGQPYGGVFEVTDFITMHNHLIISMLCPVWVRVLHTGRACLGQAKFCLHVYQAQGYETFFMFSSAETKIYPAHEC